MKHFDVLRSQLALYRRVLGGINRLYALYAKVAFNKLLQHLHSTRADMATVVETTSVDSSPLPISIYFSISNATVQHTHTYNSCERVDCSVTYISPPTSKSEYFSFRSRCLRL
ncbi:hypothetical protein PPTG_20945 [Phytophthora nicotianae INRA-310]|uniref:Uncharacterized protein n=1 Tax=Phytophthora nicotianae (strain INRA-310) TaxID=761204 RepID=W2RAY9_PHYN3|nr:hypothetical protein PPTG_20945 [Phytophthora nicotianae INRA-310]ETN22598.1 hypothetical protein PPTG_20945 [Phytophthora nicotianae INRA-310]